MDEKLEYAVQLNIYCILILVLSVDKSAVPLVQVVDTLEVFIAKSGRGHTGQLMRPTNDQLFDAFGSLKFDDIFDFMAVNGHLQQSHKRGDLEGHEKG